MERASETPRGTRPTLDAGATQCFAVTTHLVLPGDAWERIRGSGVLEGVAGTDSHPRARLHEGEGLRVSSVASVFHRWLS